MSRTSSHRWGRLAPALVTLPLIALAACGDDDTSTAAPTATPAPTASPAPATSAAPAAGDLKAFCQAQVDITRAAGEGPDVNDDATPEQRATATKAWATTLLPLAQTLADNAPGNVKADIDTQVAAVRAAADTGDGSGLGNPGFEAADQRVHAAALGPCGWKTVPVQAMEYHFMGVPDTLPAGVTSFEITNGGKELHVAVIVRKNDGVTDSFEQLLTLPEKEAMTKVTQVGAGFAPLGGSGYALVDLAPGNYLMLCPIPVGTTSEEAPPAPDAPPHFTQGMTHEFTVA